MEKQFDLKLHIFKTIKQQFYSGKITREEYLKTLVQLYENIDDIEKNSIKKDFIIQSLQKPENKITQTITIALSLN